MVGIPPDVNLLEILQDEKFVRISKVAAGALFTYDILINLDIELKYIWATLDPRKRPIKAVPIMFNLMYLVQRYSPLLDVVIVDNYLIMDASDTKSCLITYNISGWIAILGILLSELMLAIRIWAVWGRKSSITIVLVALSLGCSVPAIFFLARFLGGIQCLGLHIPGPVQLQNCFCLMKNKDLYVCWSLLMFYDSVSFVLMAIPGFRAYRRGGRSNLVKVIYRDGIIYYALMFMVSLLNIVVILLLPSSLIIIISPYERVLHSIIASHAILHIRTVASRGYLQNGDTSSRMIMTDGLTTQDTEIRFTPNEPQSGIELEQQEQVGA